MRCLLLLACVAFLTTGRASARTWYIEPYGTGDAPTIQAGIDSAAAGDTVLVACGTYYEHDIYMKSGVILIGETGPPNCVVINAEYKGRVMQCVDCDATTVVCGLILFQGSTQFAAPPGYGGGMLCAGPTGLPSITVSDCAFSDSRTEGGGAGMACLDAGVTIIRCEFHVNSGGSWGGGLYCSGPAPVTVSECFFTANSVSGFGGGVACSSSSPTISNCNFLGNTAWNGGSGGPSGSDVYCMAGANPTISNTILWGGFAGEPISCDFESAATLVCCDIWESPEADWTGCIADQLGVNGNISADPLFCDPPMGYYKVQSCSPCLPGHHPDGYDCGGVIGIFGAGCDCQSATKPTSWGTIKSIYR
jgi:hypothetical protein